MTTIAPGLPQASAGAKAAAVGSAPVAELTEALARLESGTIMRASVAGRDPGGLVRLLTEHGALSVRTSLPLARDTLVTIELQTSGNLTRAVILSVDRPPSGTTDAGARAGAAAPGTGSGIPPEPASAPRALLPGAVLTARLVAPPLPGAPPGAGPPATATTAPFGPVPPAPAGLSPPAPSPASPAAGALSPGTALLIRVTGLHPAAPFVGAAAGAATGGVATGYTAAATPAGLPGARGPAAAPAATGAAAPAGGGGGTGPGPGAPPAPRAATAPAGPHGAISGPVAASDVSLAPPPARRSVITLPAAPPASAGGILRPSGAGASPAAPGQAPGTGARNVGGGAEISVARGAAPAGGPEIGSASARGTGAEGAGPHPVGRTPDGAARNTAGPAAQAAPVGANAAGAATPAASRPAAGESPAAAPAARSSRVPAASPPASGAAPSSSPAVGAVPQAAGQGVSGRIATVGQGGIVIETSLGSLNVAARGSPPPGSVITFDVLDATPPRPLPEAAPGRVPSVADLLRTWPALDEALATLRAIDPGGAAELLNNAIPRPGPRLGAGILFFISALSAGDVTAWLGGRATGSLNRAGRPDLVGRLDEEFGRLGRLGADGGAGDWRSFLIPIHDGDQLHQLRMFLRRHGDDDGAGGASQGGHRFLLDFELSRLGAMQMDGLVQGRRFHLIVRSRRPLAEEARRDIRAIFEDGCACTGLSGEVAFAGADGFAELPLRAGGGELAPVTV